MLSRVASSIKSAPGGRFLAEAMAPLQGAAQQRRLSLVFQPQSDPAAPPSPLSHVAFGDRPPTPLTPAGQLRLGAGFAGVEHDGKVFGVGAEPAGPPQRQAVLNGDRHTYHGQFDLQASGRLALRDSKRDVASREGVIRVCADRTVIVNLGSLGPKGRQAFADFLKDWTENFPDARPELKCLFVKAAVLNLVRRGHLEVGRDELPPKAREDLLMQFRSLDTRNLLVEAFAAKIATLELRVCGEGSDPGAVPPQMVHADGLPISGVVSPEEFRKDCARLLGAADLALIARFSGKED